MSFLNIMLQSDFLTKLGEVRFRKTNAMPLSSTKQSFFLSSEEIRGSTKNCDVPKRLQSNPFQFNARAHYFNLSRSRSCKRSDF